MDSAPAARLLLHCKLTGGRSTRNNRNSVLTNRQLAFNNDSHTVQHQQLYAVSKAGFPSQRNARNVRHATDVTHVTDAMTDEASDRPNFDTPS